MGRRRRSGLVPAARALVPAAALAAACAGAPQSPPGPPRAAAGPCAEARAFAEGEVARARAGPPGAWLDGPARDSLRRAARGATAVVEVVLDTLGAPDMTTLRVVRSEGQAFVELARRALGRLEWGRYEPAPGCAARRVVVIPFHLRAERR
jgi:hypothetical protein